MNTVSKGLLSSAIISLTLLGSAHNAMAYEAGDIVTRFGAATVDPREDADTILEGPLGAPASVGVDSSTTFSFSGTYMISNNVGIELLAALPFEHTIVGTGALEGVTIADVKQLPPTLSIQYFFPEMGNLTSYVGVGINYTEFFDEDTHQDLTNLLQANKTEIQLDSSFGLAAQAGADYKIAKDWYVNASVYYIDIDTEVTIKSDGTELVTFDADLDPWVYRAGLTYKF